VRLPSPVGHMHLAARALFLALVPSIAAAQAETRFPATQQAQPHPVAAAPDAGRYLVVACPSSAGTAPSLPDQPADSATRAIVAALCARAQVPLTPQQGAAAAPSIEPDTEAMLPPSEAIGAPEPALELLMRLAEAPAGSPPTLVEEPSVRRSRPTGRGEHANHDDRVYGGLRNPDEKASDEEADAPFAPQFKVHLFADIKYSALDSVGSRNGFSLGQFDLFGRSELSETLLRSRLLMIGTPCPSRSRRFCS